MKSKAELIEISGVFDTSAEYCSFYEFAVNYLFNLKEKKITDTDRFFETIKTLGDNSGIRANFAAFGKQSRNAKEVIKPWCTKMLEHRKDLADLSVDELHYVMGYCARRAKFVKG